MTTRAWLLAIALSQKLHPSGPRVDFGPVHLQVISVK